MKRSLRNNRKKINKKLIYKTLNNKKRIYKELYNLFKKNSIKNC